MTESDKKRKQVGEMQTNRDGTQNKFLLLPPLFKCKFIHETKRTNMQP